MLVRGRPRQAVHSMLEQDSAEVWSIGIESFGKYVCGLIGLRGVDIGWVGWVNKC